ncbi:MAG: hypothetical protein J3R72DRAFT_444731 [Linnemannia gamsii]|nr:MAG: hypothetical protein J3R72DRAFT_444731 [Linnemannia gamsii]
MVRHEQDMRYGGRVILLSSVTKSSLLFFVCFTFPFPNRALALFIFDCLKTKSKNGVRCLSDFVQQLLPLLYLYEWGISRHEGVKSLPKRGKQ